MSSTSPSDTGANAQPVATTPDEGIYLGARTLEQWGYPTDITTLDLSGKGIGRIDVLALRPYRNLVSINLGNNKLTAIKAQLLDELDQVRMLDLSHNRIQRLDSSVFQDLRKVVVIDLGDNALDYVQANLFDGLTRLCVVNLQSNKIGRIDLGCMNNLPNMQEVYLGSNPIWDALGASGLQSLLCSTNPKATCYASVGPDARARWKALAKG